MTPAIRTEGLTRRFGDLLAVDHVDLEVMPSTVHGFLGPNGSGKSTTIRMLCGLLTPSAGSAEVLGYRIPGEEERLKREVGYMTQRFSLYEDLSVRENLEFIARVYAVPRSRRRARIDELIESFELGACARRRAGTLSGGEKQRLALAAAILHEPRLLFLDEPTSAVDPQSRREFWETLFQLAERGVTILVSTHYMDEAERCHRLGILDHGRLVADGAPRTLEAGVEATVLEIECADPRRAIAVLSKRDEVISSAQLGLRVRVLVQRRIDDPVALVATALSAAGLDAKSRPSTPSLEDVFVAATRGHFRRQEP